MLEEHRAILAAVESNDKERAEEVARKSVRDALGRTMRAFIRQKRRTTIEKVVEKDFF